MAFQNNGKLKLLIIVGTRPEIIRLSAVHGSHVIIAANGRKVPDDTITQAAQLAAYHSELRLGKNVSVDVTPVKQLKRPPGAKPGMVIYHTYRTVIVNPYDSIVKEIETGKPRG